ncbi:MAG: NAD(P)/FAD-dependent oxidoreductase [Christensenellales bacterium]
MEEIYDVIIIGGGPASMSAGVYAKQMGLNTLLIEKGDFGGQVATTSTVTNYLGFEKISGQELSKIMHKHLETTKVKISCEEVVKTELTSEIKTIYTHNHTYKSKAVIIGIGTSARNLGVDNERKYLNKGISYSSLKDRDKYENKVVAVVGGGNSAIEDAIYLSEKARKVYLIHRRNEFRADASVVEELKNKHNIELVLECKPYSLEGDEELKAINVLHIPSNEIRKLEVDCVFVAIGRGADTDIIDNSIIRNSQGYIETDKNMQTNLSGVYAIGDIRNTPLRQIVTAVSDGAIASVSAFNYIRESKILK